MLTVIGILPIEVMMLCIDLFDVLMITGRGWDGLGWGREADNLRECNFDCS